MHRVLALLVAAALPLSLSACGPAAGSNGRLTIAVGFYPLQYVAQRVAGTRADVVDLTQPGAEPHDLELTFQETQDIATADLVIYEGGLQPAVDEAVRNASQGATLDAASVVHLEPFAAGDTMERPGDPDPHFWHDPLRLATLADAVAAALGKVDPSHAADYSANAAALRTQLEGLDHDFATGLAHCRRTTIVVSHDAFGYLAKYGLTMAPIAGLSPDAEPTPADLAHLHDLIRSDGITTVFGERLASPKLSETLAHDLGVTTAVLDPIEGLTDQTAHQDYVSLMRANLAALRKANDC